jgi:formylglycine-generating enzyme required for sulfatase activity
MILQSKSAVLLSIILLARFVLADQIAAPVPANHDSLVNAQITDTTRSLAPDTAPLPALPRLVGKEYAVMPAPYANMVWVEGREITWNLPDIAGRKQKPDGTKRLCDGFFMDRTEVTNGQFAKFLSASDSNAEFYDSHMDIVQTQPHKFLPRLGREEFPVAWVDWTAAFAFALWAGKSLPTEEEWIIAALSGRAVHAGDTLYPWGSSADSSRCNGLRITGFPASMPVAAYPQGPTTSGIADLAGNVAEWTLTEERTIEPNGGTHSWMVVKGGSFLDPLSNLTVLNRRLQNRNEHLSSTGFRCILRERKTR